MAPSRVGIPSHLVLDIAAGVFVAVAVVTWAAAARHALSDTFLYVPAKVIAGQVRQGVAVLGGLIKSDERVAYVSGKPEGGWTCGLWQRAAYPRTVFCLDTAQPDWKAELDILTQRYQLRYLITDGALPASIPVGTRRELVGKVDLVEVGR